MVKGPRRAAPPIPLEMLPLLLPVRRSSWRAVRRVLPILTLGVAACAEADLVVNPETAWTTARTTWERRAPRRYHYEIRTACFCIVQVTQWNRVDVRDGRVIRVTQIEGQLFPGVVPLSAWPTIPELFERARPTSGGFVRSIDVDYDRDFGYPRRITVRCGPQVADCDSDTEARNLTVLPDSVP